MNNKTLSGSSGIIMVLAIIIYMKKLLDCDWLKAVQFKCNTSANYTHITILDCDLLKENRKFSKPMISHKMMTISYCRNFEKVFWNEIKNGFKKDLLALPPRKLFHVYIIKK